MFRIATLLLILLLGQTAFPAKGEKQDELQECASIPADAARLACFDAFAARIRHEESAKTDTASRQAESTTHASADSRHDEFGLGKTETASRELRMEKQRSQAGSADPVPLEIAEPAPERVVARVESFMRLNRSNRIRITLDNGQIWQETDGPRFRGSVMPGAEVTISKGRFGGYRMKVPGRSAAILVRRIK